MGFVQEPVQLVVQFDSTRCPDCQCGRGFLGRTNSSIEVQVPVLRAEQGIEQASATVPKLGQRVTLRFGEQLFSQTALLLFGLPLLLAFAGAGLALTLGAVAGMQAMYAVLGGLVGWWAARRIGARMQTRVYESLTLDLSDC